MIQVDPDTLQENPQNPHPVTWSVWVDDSIFPAFFFSVNGGRWWLAVSLKGTLPETTNIAPENRPLEKEIPIGNHHFQGRAVSFRECISFKNLYVFFSGL